MPTVSSTVIIPVEVLQPTRPPLMLSYRGTDDQTAMIAVQTYEVDLAKDLDRESFIRLYPSLLYYELDKTSTVVDTLYRETRQPVYKAPVPCPIYVVPEPPKKLLKRFGLEVEQEGLALVSAGWLERHAPDLQMKTGDRIGYYNNEYTGSFNRPGGQSDKIVVHEPEPRVPNFSWEILTTKWGDYWGNTQIPLHKVLTLKNLRAPGKPDTNVTSR